MYPMELCYFYDGVSLSLSTNLPYPPSCGFCTFSVSLAFCLLLPRGLVVPPFSTCLSASISAPLSYLFPSLLSSIRQSSVISLHLSSIYLAISIYLSIIFLISSQPS